MHKRKEIKEGARESEEERPPSLRSFFSRFIIFFRKLEVEYRTRGFFNFHFFEFLEMFWLLAVFPLVYCENPKKIK
jgi:hypothetical protein